MDAERWARVENLLHAALEVSTDQRDEFLQAECAGDPALIDEVRSLLTSDRRAGGFLQSSAMSAAARAVAATEASAQPEPVAGQLLANYRMLKRIGIGGMGSVWLAERSDGRFDRKVAIKFINIAAMSPGSLERFKREGNLLARLSHPHIAELIDAGMTEDGSPYLVLEYVEGEPIDQYCDRNQLDVSARCQLFLNVLRAVGHAHSNLIVHRDIKPSNVLVDNSGNVKLLDFGIAKLLQSEDQQAPATLLTRESGSALTPEFAAPEQLTGGPITTATDVYSLGGLLYVILTGRVVTGNAKRSAVDLFKTIVEVEPVPPSTVVASVEDGDSIAAARSVGKDKLIRQLRGDLDTIVGKSLKKEARERYTTVSAFADDLSRHLQNSPILAHPDTLFYRAGKFVRRNRKFVALSAVAVLAIIVGGIGTLVQARHARQERDLALIQLSRVERVNALNDFLLVDAAPSNKPMTVSELLQREEGIITSEDSSRDPANHVRMLALLGEQYFNADENQKSLQLLEKAYQLSLSVHDLSSHSRAACSLSWAVQRQGDHSRAELLITEGLRELPADSVYDSDRVFCLLHGSEVDVQAGAAQSAIDRALAAQRIAEASPYQSDNLKFDVLSALADGYQFDGRYAESISAFQQASVLLNKLGYGQTRTAVSFYSGWGFALNLAGQLRESEKVIRQAIDLTNAADLQDAASPELLLTYGDLIFELGRREEGLQYDLRAYEKAKRVNDRVVIEQSLMHLARIYRELKDFSRAQEAVRTVEPLLRQDLPPEHYAFASLDCEKSRLALAAGDLPSALRFIDEAIAINEAAIKSGREGAHLLESVYGQRAVVEMQLGNLASARSDAERSMKLAKDAVVQGTFSSTLGGAYVRLGSVLEKQGQREDARLYYRLGAEQFERSVGPDHPWARDARQLAGIEPSPPSRD